MNIDNQVILHGRLTKDIEPKYIQTSNGESAVVNFTIAVRRDKENADFINCVAWGKTCEHLAKYYKKGQEILATGRIQTRSYEEDGKKRYVTEIVVENTSFCGSSTAHNEKQDDFISQATNIISDNYEDDLPF